MLYIIITKINAQNKCFKNKVPESIYLIFFLILLFENIFLFAKFFLSTMYFFLRFLCVCSHISIKVSNESLPLQVSVSHTMSTENLEPSISTKNLEP